VIIRFHLFRSLLAVSCFLSSRSHLGRVHVYFYRINNIRYILYDASIHIHSLLASIIITCSICLSSWRMSAGLYPHASSCGFSNDVSCLFGIQLIASHALSHTAVSGLGKSGKIRVKNISPRRDSNSQPPDSRFLIPLDGLKD
jgi:hypothetical protein